MPTKTISAALEKKLDRQALEERVDAIERRDKAREQDKKETMKGALSILQTILIFASGFALAIWSPLTIVIGVMALFTWMIKLTVD